MSNALFTVPPPANEPVKGYAPGSPEKKLLLDTYRAMYSQPPVEVPLYIGNERITTADRRPLSPPHDHKKVIGYASFGDGAHVKAAVEAALHARKAWSRMPWEQRAAIFLKAAELLAGPFRYRMNAATMLAQSKNCHQAEIDSACELIDFLRFNVHFMQDIYRQQPVSSAGVWNRLEYRPLEGFVFAITPFNFTAIAANLPASAAMMGNVVVWKPADSQLYSAQVIMELFEAAGLPPGVINMVAADGPAAGEVVFNHPDFSGLHFTGSTGVFKALWKTIGEKIDTYKTYPRIVGETGGKDFIVAHASADAHEVAAAISRGAFEFQGQKCSAASRAYIPSNLWPAVKKQLLADVASFRVGSPEDFLHFINAVIDRKAYTKIVSYIEFVKSQPDAEIIAGGTYDDSAGYFIHPTVVVTTNPKFRTLCEEIFGPVVTIYVYEPAAWTETLRLVDETGMYALTGAVLAGDRYAIAEASEWLENAAGNFYINDKPTGAVVGQQPFGGARGSGTNDKAGSYLNLLRWVSPRTIKETFVPPKDYRYPWVSGE